MYRRRMRKRAFHLVAVALALAPNPLAAADISVRQLAQSLFAAEPGKPVDLSGRSLSFLDLAGLDFKGATLARTDMYGVDLTDAKLAGADLAHTNLDRATLRRTDFSGANLSGASLRTLSVSDVLPPLQADAPRFTRANLSDATIEGRLDGTDFSGADLSRARIGYQTAVWGSYKPRSVMVSCNFTGAVLVGASFNKAVLQFARFNGADLRDIDLAGADLSGADFTGADLTGADLGAADLDGAILKDARGLDRVKGLATALHADKALR